MQSELYTIATIGRLTRKANKKIATGVFSDLPFLLPVSSFVTASHHKPDHIQFLMRHSRTKIESSNDFTKQNDVLLQPYIVTLKVHKTVSPYLDGSCLHTMPSVSQGEAKKKSSSEGGRNVSSPR